MINIMPSTIGEKEEQQQYIMIRFVEVYSAYRKLEIDKDNTEFKQFYEEIERVLVERLNYYFKDINNPVVEEADLKHISALNPDDRYASRWDGITFNEFCQLVYFRLHKKNDIKLIKYIRKLNKRLEKVTKIGRVIGDYVSTFNSREMQLMSIKNKDKSPNIIYNQNKGIIEASYTKEITFKKAKLGYIKTGIEVSNTFSLIEFKSLQTEMERFKYLKGKIDKMLSDEVILFCDILIDIGIRNYEPNKKYFLSLEELHFRIRKKKGRNPKSGIPVETCRNYEEAFNNIFNLTYWIDLRNFKTSNHYVRELRANGSAFIKTHLIDGYISRDKDDKFNGIYFSLGEIGVLQMELKQISNSKPVEFLQLDLKDAAVNSIGNYLNYLYTNSKLNKNGKNYCIELKLKTLLDELGYLNKIKNAEVKHRTTLLKRFLEDFKKAILIFKRDNSKIKRVNLSTIKGKVTNWEEEKDVKPKILNGKNYLDDETKFSLFFNFNM